MKKKVIGGLYGIFLESLLRKANNWRIKFEKEYLCYCRNGCKQCYKWNCYCRSEKEGTPYKKFRRKYYN